ncbi:STAS domain-containing protein [Pseudoalteromonas sp. JBTF-M23]|uniref:STAS domain-containing protein n=1 Tax=Pseudoalteromonas caenipelagi TaxID=2726988 RepID=A0A849VIY4_9GAMM|nr:STAS domain-containing protein [Pseudoalteromonas caenipelagi]NOU52760.1 STAS domain-containing protein [Pseudoalteromonas caenipelagi]
MLKLPSELAINQVEELHQQVLHELAVEQDVCVDISEVTRVDTASIQLLCALQKHLLTVSHKILWHGHSQAFSNSVEELGLTEFLALNGRN